MSEGIIIAVISLVGGLLNTIVGKVLELRQPQPTNPQPNNNPPASSSNRLSWQLFAGGFIATLALVGLYIAISHAIVPTKADESILAPIRQAAYAYEDFETNDALARWSLGNESSPHVKLGLADSGLIGAHALLITAPVSSTEKYDFHVIQTMSRKFKASAIIARVRWPEKWDGVKISYAVLCVRLVGLPYDCESLPQTTGSWQTFVFNLHNGGESKSDVSNIDIEGLALIGKFEKTGSQAPLTIPLHIDGLEIWSE